MPGYLEQFDCLGNRLFLVNHVLVQFGVETQHFVFLEMLLPGWTEFDHLFEVLTHELEVELFMVSLVFYGQGQLVEEDEEQLVVEGVRETGVGIQ